MRSYAAGASASSLRTVRTAARRFARAMTFV